MATGGLSKQVYTSYSCQLCRNVDTPEMVQCDYCNLWYHFECVGVTSDIEYEDWLCGRCNQLQTALREFNNGKLPGDTSQSQGVVVSDTFSYKSTKVSSRVSSLTARQKVKALQKLQEEQLIKLDILNRKYRILEGDTESESPEEDGKEDKQSSLDYTLQWARKVQGVSNDFAKMSFLDNISISLSDHEREAINKRSAEDLTKAAERTQVAVYSNCALRQSILSSKPIPGHQRPHHLSLNSGQPTSKIASVAEGGSKRFQLGDREDCVRNFKGFNVDFGPQSISERKQQSRIFGFRSSEENGQRCLENENQAMSGQRSQEQFIRAVDPEQREREVTFNFGSGSGQGETNFNTGSKSIPIRSSANVGGSFDWNDLYDDQQTSTNQPSTNQSIHQPMQSFRCNAPPIRAISGGPVQPTATTINTSGYKSNTTLALTRENIASRQVFKDLPEFHGKVEDWPIFLSALLNSTEACGYTDSENLGRLQKALQGDAKGLVQSRLLHAKAVPGVVETLHLIFGRPSLIIHQLLEKINKTPQPREDDLCSLIKFAISVQNLGGTIEASGHLEYLQNPILIQNLTDKMPTQIQ